MARKTQHTSEDSTQSQRIAAGQILIAGIMWGLVGPLVQLMQDAGSTAEATALIRMVFAFVIMGLFSLLKFGPGPFKVSGKTLLLCAFLGIVSNGLYNVVYSMAIVNAGITVSAVLLNSAPIFTILGSAILFHEGITPLKVVALGINILGCSLAATGGQLDVASVSLLGIGCGIAAAFTYGIAALFARVAGSDANSYVISTYSYLFAALGIAVFFQPWEALARVSTAAIGYGFLLALIPTSFAYLLYYKGVLALKETSKVPILASVEMVSTAIISALFFGEVLTGATILGIVLVIASIALMNTKFAAKH